VLHISPQQVANYLADFAKHHYLIAGFICLVISVVLLSSIETIVKESNPSKMIQAGTTRRSRRKKMRVMVSNIAKTIHPHSTESGSQLVDKSHILANGIHPTETLTDATAKFNRMTELKNALSLGNLYKQKVIIYFMDGPVKKHTVATIWHVDEENVCLKGGAVLPVKSIYKINF